jgi:stage IV sporulation protein FB
MMQFSLFNIPVRVLPWFWLTLALIGGIGADTKAEIIELLLFILAGFISVLVHELGHALTAKHFGKRVEIVLQAFGGYAAYSGPGHLSRNQSISITAAGPAIQILLGIAAKALVIYAVGLNHIGLIFFETLFEISIFWAVLNLLPVLPMDGGRILETLLGPARLRLTLQISIGVAVTIVVFALLYPIPMLLPIFMGLMAYENYKSLKSISW